ncbi:Z-ring formation inhibitor MciZ [Mesobacillus zeae]
MHSKGFVMVGKAWEISNKLKEWKKSCYYVKDWVEAAGKPPTEG